MEQYKTHSQTDSNSHWPVLSTIKYSSNEGQQAYQYEVVPFINNQSIKELTNLGLIELYLRTKKESVWQEFYSRIDPYVRTYITKVLRSYEKIILLTQQDFVSLREDLVQEVYLKLLNNNCRVLRLYSSNDNNSVFYSYLHRVTTNLVIDYCSKWNRQKRQVTLLSLEDAETSIDENSNNHNDNYELNISRDNNKGFSIIELLIVIIITFISISTISAGYKGYYLNVGVDEVISECTLKLYTAQEAAKCGSTNIAKRTFDINNATTKPHYGITVTSTPIPSFVDTRCLTNCGNQASICISGQNFCFTPENSFSFETFSGKTTNSHILFINSTNRQIAVLINENGEYYIAELINGFWHSRRELILKTR